LPDKDLGSEAYRFIEDQNMRRLKRERGEDHSRLLPPREIGNLHQMPGAVETKHPEALARVLLVQVEGLAKEGHRGLLQRQELIEVLVVAPHLTQGRGSQD